ncbi:ComEC/Rec2 family competence protein [Nocardioides sp. BP30]|uniref:ComEC/Rec2 family competence protein n=1 Tax=Nocardioides sp. BP30 TaxID=3036374 RepID=UPI00246880DD|nr:ComEC/Rec2 family competence protein [Nocardioides sp. BP30]WGL51153.1 ComEC/Rec2 family competence protein [Nocardioides sp. BP30]
MRDLRLPLLGACAWVGGLAVEAHLPIPPWVLILPVAVGATITAACRPRLRATVVAALAVLLTVVAVAGLRTAQMRHDPVAQLARRGAVADVVGVVTSDARTVVEAHGTQQLLRVQIRRVTGRGQAYAVRAPVILLGDDAWAGVRLGTSITTSGRLVAADDSDVAALLLAQTEPQVVAPPSAWWSASSRLRAQIRASVAGRPAAERAIVPALVDGDESDVDDALADSFRATGLTHLLAVSGTNLTLVVGFLLLVARWAGVRGRWLTVVAASGIGGFVLLARSEPSVLRAAAMGAVGLLAMGHNGRSRALRGLGAAVVGLMLLDPVLAVSPGFALSVLATAGILLLAPAWRDALGRWLPRWLAEAIAVPAAAQLACTPLIAVISGQVSVVAVPANLLAEPAVGPATVLGLLGGLVGLVWPGLGRCFGWLASWCVAWIVAVARHAAALPTAALDWGTGVIALTVLTVLTVAAGLCAPRLLRHRGVGAACCLSVVVASVVRWPTPGWPPADWVYVVCDVGQGDGTVLRVGPHTAVVVDAGPDPGPMDACLDRLQVRRVALFVLTHFHADHVDGVGAVFDGRQVDRVWTTRLQDPPDGVALLQHTARSAGVAPVPAPYGASVRIGEVTLQVLWPLPDSPTEGPGDGSTANGASVVLLALTHGIRILLTGDVEPDGQEEIARTVPGLAVDVLKIPHHGSRYQDEGWLLGLRPRLAIASVGADNDYGHPAASTLGPLTAAGIPVLRTDRDGTVAVTVGANGLGYATR